MLITVLFPLFLNNAKSQEDREKQQDMAELPETVAPSKGVIIVVLSIMFTIAFLLLIYVKFCRVTPLHLLNQNPNLQTIPRSRSGITRKLIETLPFFKFSSLKGSKEGLECTVCLSTFEDAEILRLLPKCKHAFHMNCIDTWLESHSTCPLCRYKVEEVDIKNFTYSLSSRFLRVPSNLSEDPNLDIFIQREPSSRRKCEKEEVVVVRDQQERNHRIFVSDVFTRSRWSDLNSSDLLSLNCEMLNDMSSERFSCLDNDEEENSFTALNPGEKRSMSEIANVPRRNGNGIREIVASSSSSRGSIGIGSEERLWRIWLPIARRTVQWFARQERNSVQLQHSNRFLASNV